MQQQFEMHIMQEWEKLYIFCPLLIMFMFLLEN